MYKSRRSIINLVILLFVFYLLIGCLIANANSNIPVASKLTHSSTLKSWVREYLFSEYAPPDENMFYGFSIYKKNNSYYADISIDGFQTMARLQAKVLGDKNSIKLLFDKYLPDNNFEPYKKGDVLLSLKKTNSKIYTYWGKIQPMLYSNMKSGKVYFKTKH